MIPHGLAFGSGGNSQVLQGGRNEVVRLGIRYFVGDAICLCRHCFHSIAPDAEGLGRVLPEWTILRGSIIKDCCRERQPSTPRRTGHDHRLLAHTLNEREK